MFHKNDKEIQWFKNAGFGLFIHWGLYAALEGYWKGKETKGIGEWICSRERIPVNEYEEFADRLVCDQFNPEMWAKLAKSAGMKYCVFTAKHHEGFAMFDTDFDDYSIVKRSPYGKDVVKEIVDAMRKEGIVPCLYYSHALDFHDRNAYGNTWDFSTPEEERDVLSYWNGKCKHQLKELLTYYGDIGMIWMDVPRGVTKEMAMDLKKYVKDLQPKCLVSGRICSDRTIGDFGCYGDNQIPNCLQNGCWETAATMNDTWGYKKDDHNFKSPKELIELLCALRSKGTNLLLNIGPKPDGRIPEESIAILEEFAKWNKVNAEALYDVEASPFSCDFTFGSVSSKDNVLYLYVTEKKAGIDLYGIKNRVVQVHILGGNEIPFTQGDVLHIDCRDVEFGCYVTVVKVILDGSVCIRKGVFQQEGEHVILPAISASIIQTEKKEKSQQLIGDDAVKAENQNLSDENQMSIGISGMVRNWNSERNYLEWSFELMEEGDYDVYLYSVTQKYRNWIGGHEVCISIGEDRNRTTLTADQESAGPNKKYFSETGSFLGRFHLACGQQRISLSAVRINPEDPEGLSVSKIHLRLHQCKLSGGYAGHGVRRMR